jgi:glycosyltransferase involved in cell wall biosynthesis
MNTVDQNQTLGRESVGSQAASNLLFISWAENCSRSDSLAERLCGISSMIYSPVWKSRYSTIAFKYLSQCLKTVRILCHYKPQTVLVMTPPVIACIPVWAYAKLRGAQYVIDAHTAAFVDRRWTPFLFLHKFFSRHAAATIVTNQFLADIVRKWGASSKIVSDVPICFPKPSNIKLKGPVNMTFISTFTPDEPLVTFLLATRRVSDVHFYVTGRLKDAPLSVLKQAPDNVTFTDFLSGSDYVGLLLASDAVICLTTVDHTMQRGAYEAVYLGKPVITSNFNLLREAFPSGTVHVDETAEDIARGIAEMRDSLTKYQRDVEQLRILKLRRWSDVQKDLSDLLKNSRRDR